MDETISKVYVKIDEQSRIVALEGGYTTPQDLSSWVQIDEGYGDKYNLCQSNYLPKPLYTEEGISQYKLQDSQIVERSAEEIETDRTALPPAPPSDATRLDILESAVIAIMMGGNSDV